VLSSKEGRKDAVVLPIEASAAFDCESFIKTAFNRLPLKCVLSAVSTAQFSCGLAVTAEHATGLLL
jgi:hypothetical protein